MLRSKFSIPVLLLSFSAFIFSCKKETGDDGYITENKIVIDYVSGRPVPAQKIYIGTQGVQFRVTMEPWNFLGADTSLIQPGPLSIHDSLMSDMNGRFSYRYTQTFDAAENIYIKNGSPILPSEYCVVYPSRIPPGGSQSDTIYVDRAATITLTIQKNSPAGLSDTLYENIELTSRAGTFQQRLSLLKAQVGLTSAIVKHFFPKNFHDSAFVSWRLYNHGLQSFGEDTIVLSSSGINNLNITY